ncbi:MAG: GGDEF domain-containing protein, partial [Lachnospiraceae bacterium]|nr:GGDEF domain-containing protein [Lachnospiraceae bacterium]
MKKIAVFIGEVTSEYQTEVAKGIIEASAEIGVQSFVFTNSGVYGGTFLYGYGEKNVVSIPYLEDYDGIIIGGDTFGVEGMYEDVTRLLEKEAKCPIVCIRQQDSRFYNVLVDNYQAMSDMVEHFINHHGFERICFMTGKLDMYDAQRRLLGYIDTMQKHGLKVTPDMVFEGDYWRSRGQQAVEWFTQGEQFPQAIVCANDYMAISVCNALYGKGLRVPEDICVSGYDDVDEAKYSIPSISSMHVSACEMGRAAVRILKNVNEGAEQEKDVYIAVEPCYRGSCGCSDEKDGRSTKELFILKEAQQRILYHTSVMRIALDNQDDFPGLVSVSNAYIRDFGQQAIYLCFCEESSGFQESTEINQTYTERMHLRAVYEDGECRVCDEVFDRRDILPRGYLKENEAVYIYPFHEKHNCLGYVVLKVEDIGRMQYVFSAWVQAMASAVERQRMYRLSKDLQELKLNYNRDALTGIGNRREAERVMAEYSMRMYKTGRIFCIVSLDMDGLKIINDKYGHLQGDEALCVVARILKEVVVENGSAARIGGDEYVLCLDMDTDDEVRRTIATIREKIAE